MIDEYVCDGSSELRLYHRFRNSLDLGSIAPSFPCEIARDLIADQYQASLNFIYSHPYWDRLRTSSDPLPVYAYLLETRHYLHASASRMAPGLSTPFSGQDVVSLVAEHVVEEAGHARFFDGALEALGVDTTAPQYCRPNPVTVTWISLMRSLSGSGPLVSIIVSGLMETSGSDSQTISAWHKMLSERGLLSESAAASIYRHIELDMALEHGSNWTQALGRYSYISASLLAECLNAVATVSEMVYIWLNMLEVASSGLVVESLVESRASFPLWSRDALFDGEPVWPASILDEVVYGGTPALGARLAMLSAYHQLSTSNDVKNPILATAAELAKDLAFSSHDSPVEMISLVDGWQRAIDGHRLWKTMCNRPSTALVYGWLLENYSYLKTAPIHVGSAIKSCSDPVVRDILVKHLEEEANHAEILAAGLRAALPSISPNDLRPLPTTVAFTSFLQEIATADWKAYCIALLYLQRSLSRDDRNERFYNKVSAVEPGVRDLLSSIAKHDGIDSQLGHGDEMDYLVAVLQDRHGISAATIAYAARIAEHSYMFLSGIHDQYASGKLVSICQRVGWSATGIA
jgi:hypothetical protein